MSDAMFIPPLKLAVIDDNIEFGIGIKMLLAKEEVVVHTAADGFEGLELVKQQTPDIVLLDVVMPGMDGVEVCKEIRKIPEMGGAYIVMLSSLRIQTDQMSEGLEAGADGYIARPITNRELLARLRSYIRIKRTEKKLEITEEKYRRIAENVTDVVWITDLEMNPTYISPSVERVFGLKPEEYLKLPLTKAYPPASLEKFKKTLTEEFAKEQDTDGDKNRIIQLEVERYYADGTIGWDAIKAKFVRDKQMNPVAIQGVSHDITERKKAEEALRKSEERFRVAQEMSPDGFSILHPVRNEKGEIIDFTWIYQNQTIARINETDPEEIKGNSLLELFPNHRGTSLFETYLHIANTGESRILEEIYVGEVISRPTWLRLVIVSMDNDIAILSQDITERKLAEEALRESEARFRSIFEIASLGIAQVDPRNGRIILVNAHYEAITGYSIDELLKMTFMELTHPDDREQDWEIFSKAARGEFKYRNEKRYVKKDGTIVWVRIHLAFIRDENDKPIRTVAICEDITERKQAEEALQRIEWMLSKKTEGEKKAQTPHYGILSDMNTNGLILGSVGKNVLEDIANDSLRLLETSSAIYEKNGEYALGIFASGWCRFMDQASRELCNTDHNNEALNCGKWICHESCWKEASLPAIVSGQPVDIECQGGIHLYALPIIAGDEVIGAINFGYGDPPQDKEKLSELAERYKVPLDELMKRAKEYQSRPPFIIEMAKERLQASSNLIGEIVSRKMAEKEIITLNEELEQRVIERTAELEASNKELEAFSYTVAHDLRAPLRHINGYVNLLSEIFHTDLPEKAHYYLKTVKDSAKQMGVLIDELLQFSKTGRQEVRKAKIDMNELVKEIVSGLKQNIENREIFWEIQELPEVFGDYSMLKQVWLNLIDNAVKYTRNTKKAEISISFKEEDKNFIFFVRDNGVGFDMKYAHKLFGVFQRLHSQTEFEGTGIGLANVQRIIHKHNGRVWVEAEPGKGATFFFSLQKNR